MPELNEILDTPTEKVDKVIDVTTIEKQETSVPPAPAKKAPTKAPVKKSATPTKKAEPKPEIKPEAAPENNKSEETKPESVTAPVEKKSTKKQKEEPDTETETEKALRRPPMEQLTKDFEKYLLTLEIGGKPLQKLGYTLGKVIYGLPLEDSKDFRVIAFKARKKSKSVAGKSRCIYYFGLSKDLTNITKKFAGTSTSNFGKCAVQVEKPVQLILDKTTYDEHFGQDVEKVMTTFKSLCELTIEQKNEQWKLFQEKIDAKKKAETEKNKKTAKVQKKATVGEE